MAGVSRRKITSLIKQSVNAQPIHKAFLTDLMSAIEVKDTKDRRKPSPWYKPSSFTCLRQMYFMRTQAEEDQVRTEYNAIGMADTGSRRHEAIQAVLEKIHELGFDWKYIDVETYVKEQQAKGFCTSLQIVGKRGAETKLFDTTLKLSFMCDGIIQRISTNDHYLFEFKNQISFKYRNKESVDKEHIPQVSCYCTALNLDKALVVYEDRDCCTLECPEVLEITPKMKEQSISKIFECENYVEKLIPPPAHSDKKPCRWCRYQTACRKAGN